MNHPKEFAEGLSIGIIMDGNGRWAKQRGLPRTAGHKKGAAVFQDIANYCEELGVSSVTFYAFSTENWKRPLEEVSAIMKLFGEYLLKGFNYKDRNIRIKFLGDRAALDQKLQKLMNELEEDSAAKTGMTLNIAVNYGGRPEIVRAARQLAGRKQQRQHCRRGRHPRRAGPQGRGQAAAFPVGQGGLFPARLVRPGEHRVQHRGRFGLHRPAEGLIQFFVCSHSGCSSFPAGSSVSSR